MNTKIECGYSRHWKHTGRVQKSVGKEDELKFQIKSTMRPIDLKLLRISIGLKQKDAAAEMGIPRSALSRIEDETYMEGAKYSFVYEKYLLRKWNEHETLKLLE